MTIPGKTERAHNPKALQKDKQSRGLASQYGPLDDIDVDTAAQDQLMASASEGDDPGAVRDDQLTGKVPVQPASTDDPIRQTIEIKEATVGIRQDAPTGV